MNTYQFELIKSNPEYYYVYFDQQYINTLNLILKLENNNVQLPHLYQMRMVLAASAGKRAITMGFLKKKNPERLFELWKSIMENQDINPISESIVKNFESLIIKIEKECLT